MSDDCKYGVDRSNLYQVRKQVSENLCDIDKRLVTIEGDLLPHKLYDSVAHSDVDASLPLEQRHVLAWNAPGKFAPDFRMNWRGHWIQQEYQKHDVVTDTPYTMIANKVTSDPAKPQNVGDPDWDLPDQPIWATYNNVSVVGSGHEYIFNETVYLNSVRVWIPAVGADITYRLTMVGETSVVQKELTTMSANQWNVIGVDPILVPSGAIMLVYLESVNSGGHTTVTGGWTYDGTNNNNPPPNQSWNTNTQQSVLRIDFDDLDSIGRQTELEGIIIGSDIQFVEVANPNNSITYRVGSAPMTGATSVDYGVVIVDQGIGTPAAGQATSMTATIPVPQATDFVGVAGGWAGNQPAYADVISILAYDGVDQGVDPDNQYGISINVQRIVISPDWDVVALSGGSGSGGGGDATDLAGYLGEAFPSGLYDGGELNIVNAGANIEIIEGAGVLVDPYDDPLDIPSKINLSWATQDQPITTPATAGNIAWFTIANAGTVGLLPNANLGVLVERSTQPTPAQMRDEVFIGFAIHNGTDWGEVHYREGYQR